MNGKGMNRNQREEALSKRARKRERERLKGEKGLSQKEVESERGRE